MRPPLASVLSTSRASVPCRMSFFDRATIAIPPCRASYVKRAGACGRRVLQNVVDPEMRPQVPLVSTSAPPRCLDGGDIDLLHRHHRLEGTLCLTATSGKRLGQRAGGDLPGEAPAVLAPTALALLAAIADDRVPV